MAARADAICKLALHAGAATQETRILGANYLVRNPATNCVSYTQGGATLCTFRTLHGLFEVGEQATRLEEAVPHGGGPELCGQLRQATGEPLAHARSPSKAYLLR